MFIVLLFLAFFLLRIVYFRAGLISASFIHASYCFGCMVMISVVFLAGYEKDDLHFTAMPMPFFGDQINLVIAVYTFLIGIVLLLPKNNLDKVHDKRTNLSFLIREKFDWLNNQSMTSWGGGVLFTFVGVFIILNTIHYVSINSDFLYSNTYYLLLKEPSLIGLESTVGKLYHLIFRYIGLVCALLFFVFLSCRSYFFAFLLFLASAYPFVFLLAGDSRWAPMYLIWGVVVFLIMGNKISSVVSLLVFMLVMIKVLVGRELIYHGIDHLFDFVTVVSVSDIPSLLLGVFVNVFEGSMNLANTLIHSPDFNIKYKILSYSPLFSFIDGFDLIRDDMKYKWAPHVPMSAISESISFGLGYFFLLLTPYLYLIRKVDCSLTKSGSIFPVLGLVVFTYISFGMHTYSIRTFWKMLVFLSLIYLIVGMWNRDTKGE